MSSIWDILCSTFASVISQSSRAAARFHFVAVPSLIPLYLEHDVPHGHIISNCLFFCRCLGLACRERPKEDIATLVAAAEPAVRTRPTTEAYVDLSLRCFQARNHGAYITAPNQAAQSRKLSLLQITSLSVVARWVNGKRKARRLDMPYGSARISSSRRII
jgi:hypothetical protein